MPALFAISLVTLVYIYVGYPVLAAVLARLFGKAVAASDITPRVSLLIPAYNEEAFIDEKLRNSLALDYPRDRLEIVVASDGSTDRTDEIVRRYSASGIRLLRVEHVGKTPLLNLAVPTLHGEIVVFSDVSSRLEPDALRVLLRNFADPSVGCVSGSYRMAPASDVRASGEGLYWRYEKWLKQQESRLHSILGAHGAFYAIRREHFAPLPATSINDDYVIPMRIVSRGARAVYEPAARAWELESASVGGEFARRRRIAVGNCQQVVMLRRLLSPARGWVAWSFFSHKVLRTIAPILMVLVFVTSFWLPGPAASIALGAQGLFYASALAGYLCQRRGRMVRWLSPPLYFCLGNLAMLAGLIRYLTAGSRPVWERAR